MMKHKLSYLLVFVVITCTCMLLSGQSQIKPKTPQPNIIIILTDDMGYGDVSTFGGNFVNTPNIDRIAAEGLKLTQYYSGAPICSPSRASLLTGMYAGKWNFTTFLDTKKHNKDAEQADFLNADAPSISRFFKSSGYITGHFGKWHMGGGRDVTNAPKFVKYGIDEYASTYESPEPDPALTATKWIWSEKDSIKRWDRTKYFVDKTLDFMKRHKGKPCFINLWPDDVHTPWVPRSGTEFNGKFPMDPQEEEAFKGVLEAYDVQIGRLLDGLQEIGVAENTLVIFTSDNGPAPSFRGSRSGGFRGAKASLYEGGIRMPFIVSWPGHIPKGKIDNQSVLHATDLLPSLAKIAGVVLPKDYRGDGVDRSALLLGKPSPRNKDIYWEYGRNDIAYNFPKGRERSPRLAIRSGDWKLLMDSDKSKMELYDMAKDPKELDNLEGTNPKITQQLGSKLLLWWQSLPKLDAK